MVKQEIARGAGGRVVIVDSITQVTAEEAGAIVVSGSHGGASHARSRCIRDDSTDRGGFDNSRAKNDQKTRNEPNRKGSASYEALGSLQKAKWHGRLLRSPRNLSKG